VLKRGSELELIVEKVADKGKSLTRLDGYVIFIQGGIPGDRLRVRIIKTKKKFAEAVPIEILEPSPDRIEPRCSHFGTCGGCKWQHMTYTAQLNAKRISVDDALTRVGGLSDINVHDVIGADPIYRYRNKMEFSFSAERWLSPSEIASGLPLNRSFALGLHVPGNFSKVLDLSECHLHSEIGEQLVNRVRAFALENNWAPWHVRKHNGFLRHLVLRKSAHTDDFMVNVVTNGSDSERMAELATMLAAEFPAVTTLVNTINTGVAQTAFGEEIRTISGSGIIRDKIGPYTFEIAPNAFFQTNTYQAENLYKVAATFAELKKTDHVYDLYSGAGTISIYIANQVKHVTGVELIDAATENAKRNAEVNGIDNVSFVTGDMMKLFNEDFIAENGRPDVLIVDPPRAGMHPKVVEQIRTLRPERFVYVSCNPVSQARDLSLLQDAFVIEEVQPVDLFPHTDHIENVIKLRARNSGS
jgi:23S rRNA (uracil1939-C5)-methyltransferase